MYAFYDQYRRCVCGHIKAHHRIDEPWACRLDCECESFMPKGGARAQEEGQAAR